MNKAALILVILLAAVSLSACANNPASTAYGTGAEVVASAVTTEESGGTGETEETASSTSPAPSFVQVTESVSESPTVESAESTKPEVTEKPTSEVSKPTETEKPKETASSTTEESATPTNPPSSEQTQESTPTVTEPPAPVFDVSSYVSFAKSYGQSIGLSLDSTATGCWDTPIEAHAGCIYLERDIRDCLDWYKASGFTAFWAWSVDLGGGNHEIFIGYA